MRVIIQFLKADIQRAFLNSVKHLFEPLEFIKPAWGVHERNRTVHFEEPDVVSLENKQRHQAIRMIRGLGNKMLWEGCFLPSIILQEEFC